MFFTPDQNISNQKLFAAPPGSTTQLNSWQAWHKPAGAVMAHITLVGPGGGGGGGFAAAASTQRGGGGGGGSGARTYLTIPLSPIIDTLYIWVGVGGAGGVSGAAGGGGTATYISLAPNDTTVQSALALAQAGGGGGTGSATIAGPAGSAGSATVVGNCPLIANFLWYSIIGDTGAAGGVSAAGTSRTLLANTTPMCGGAGGAGCTSGNVNAAGGDITVSGYFKTKVAGGAAAGGKGTDGYVMEGGSGFSVGARPPFMAFAGAGGGSNGASGTGGAGGVGVFGMGGGGGGAGVTGGAGGKGGDGWVLIQCW